MTITELNRRRSSGVDANGYDWNSGEEFYPTSVRSDGLGPTQAEVDANAARREAVQSGNVSASNGYSSASNGYSSASNGYGSASNGYSSAANGFGSARDGNAYENSGTSSGLDSLRVRGNQVQQDSRRSHLDENTLNRWMGRYDQAKDAATRQIQDRVDYGVRQGINSLHQVEEDANEQYNTMRNQIAYDERRAMDNQALRNAIQYGGASGVGNAQLDSISAAAMRNRHNVNLARTKLSTDCARQAADLRAQGEFEKADALLQITQQYLAQLTQMEQYALDYNQNVDAFNAQMDQWAANYAMQVEQMGISASDRQQALDFQKQQWEYGVRQDELNRAERMERYAAEDARDARNWDFQQTQYKDSRADAAWKKDMEERQYADSRTDAAFQQDVTLQQLANAARQISNAENQQAVENQRADRKELLNTVNTMLANNFRPSDTMLRAAGYDPAFADMLLSAQKETGTPLFSSGASTASGTSASAKPATSQSMTRATAERMAKNGQWSDTMYDALLRGGYTVSDLDLIYGSSESYQKYMKSRKQATTGASAGADTADNVPFHFSEDDGIITVNGRKFENAADAARYIRSLNLSDAQAENLANRILLWPRLAQTLLGMLEE